MSVVPVPAVRGPAGPGHAHAADCPPDVWCAHEEPLSEAQVQRRLLLALSGGALLAAGWVLGGVGNDFSGGMLEALACLLLAGPILLDAWGGLKHGHVGFPSLVALAFLACLAGGELTTAGLVAFFMITASQLEHRTALGARQAIEALIRATPATSRRITESGAIEEVPVGALGMGDVILVRPGDGLSVDGVVVEGESSVDESSITGESYPVDKRPGSPLYAGTTNLTGAVRARVERIGDDTTVGRVKKLILAAARSKLPLMGVMEENAGWYTPCVLMLAAAVYYFQYGVAGALEKSVAVLIMACPCSLILAAPSVMVAAITAAARAGILVKNAVELEFFHRVEHIFFDKTGTLTTGEMELAAIVPVPGLEASDALQLAGTVARVSSHPAARGVARALERARLAPLEAVSVEEVHGRGLKGSVGGRTVLLGRPEWVAELCGVPIPAASESTSEGSRLLLGVPGEGLRAELLLEDRLRLDAAESIRDLRAGGVRTFSLITGDAWEPARRVSSAVGCDEVVAKCLPEDKLRLLDAAKAQGQLTAVVGDGINDAPVLAAGHVGIAMGALGSQVAIESASIALMSSSLGRLPFLHKLSKAVRNLIGANLAIGLSVIAAGLLLILAGLLTPVAAALLHNVSALIILFNSARLVKMRPAG